MTNENLEQKAEEIPGFIHLGMKEHGKYIGTTLGLIAGGMLLHSPLYIFLAGITGCLSYDGDAPENLALGVTTAAGLAVTMLSCCSDCHVYVAGSECFEMAQQSIKSWIKGKPYNFDDIEQSLFEKPEK